MTVTTVITMAGVLALLGAVLAWRGWRGRRVGDHPYCRRCGFNLFGRAGEVQVCSECGADLTIPRAIVTGVRQRRPGMILSGAAMLVPTVILLLTIIAGSLAGVDWNKRKPAWWLTREAQSVDTGTRDAALKELIARFGAGTLSKTELAAAIDAGLKYQGLTDRAWSTGWGDLIEGANGKAMISESQWKTYVQQSVVGSMTLRMRDKLRAGDPIAYRLDRAGDRVGSTGPRLYKSIRVNGLVIDGNELMTRPASSGTTSNVTSRGGGFTSGTLDDAQITLSQLSPGTHTGYMRVRVSVSRAAQSFGSSRPPSNVSNPAALQGWLNTQRVTVAGADPSLGEVELKLPVKFEIVAADQPIVRRIDDEKLRRGVEQSINVERVRVVGGRFDVQISSSGPPADLSYAVSVRDGEKEWPAGTIAFKKDESTRRQMAMGGFSSTGEIPNPSSSTVEVVLRPDPAAAMRSLDIGSYWNGEVVIKNVPLDNLTRMAGGMMQTALRTLDNGDVVSSYIMPRAEAASSGTSGGVMLTIRAFPAKDGVVVPNAPATSTRELLIFLNRPFLDRTSADRKTTGISGTLRSGAGSRWFKLKLDLSIAAAGGTEQSSYSDLGEVTLDKPQSLGVSGDTARTVTLTLPK